MYLDNVYTGFTIDGKDRCLQKVRKTLYTDNGDVNAFFYLDLESSELFEISFVDEKSLQPITALIGEKKWKRKRKVVEIYKADRNIQIDLGYAFYGNIIYRLKIERTDSFEEIAYRKNVLMARMDRLYGKVMDVKCSKLYYEYDNYLTGFLAQEVRPINYVHTESGTLAKRKLLEIDYRKEL